MYWSIEFPRAIQANSNEDRPKSEGVPVHWARGSRALLIESAWDASFGVDGLNLAAIPEPATAVLLGASLLLITPSRRVRTDRS